MTVAGLLSGRRCLVTGAGSGIGRATCERMALAGASVVALDVDPDAAAATAGLVGGLPVVADVADPDSLARAMRSAEEHLGGLDVLFNNAGIGALKSLHRYDDETFDRLIDV
ncbi:MAG TPA: SDR family NAD(P)-dependent oxidoreductase, partial [Acidimicrobiales bacterium]|nr:SDR family NAD(P)-dependent oxidoreductase [Acidimicrobiales bacterium]